MGIYQFIRDVVIPIKYHSAKNFNDYGLAPVKTGAKWGIINQAGETVVPFKFQSIHLFENHAVVRYSDKTYPVLFDGTPLGFSYDDID